MHCGLTQVNRGSINQNADCCTVKTSYLEPSIEQKNVHFRIDLCLRSMLRENQCTLFGYHIPSSIYLPIIVESRRDITNWSVCYLLKDETWKLISSTIS